MPVMKTFLGSASGVAVGTLMYTIAFSSDHQPDWARAVVVGIAYGLLSVLWSWRKKSKSSAPDSQPTL